MDSGQERCSLLITAVKISQEVVLNMCSRGLISLMPCGRCLMYECIQCLMDNQFKSAGSCSLNHTKGDTTRGQIYGTSLKTITDGTS